MVRESRRAEIVSKRETERNEEKREGLSARGLSQSFLLNKEERKCVP